MREMRLNKREIKDPDMLRDIIESCDIVRLGLRDRDGMFIVPVNYGYDIETDGTGLKLTLYIHGAREGRKAEAFAADPAGDTITIDLEIRNNAGDPLLGDGDALHLHYWGDNIQGTAWPGVEATNLIDTTDPSNWKVTLPAGVTAFVINDDNGNQTQDIRVLDAFLGERRLVDGISPTYCLDGLVTWDGADKGKIRSYIDLKREYSYSPNYFRYWLDRNGQESGTPFLVYGLGSGDEIMVPKNGVSFYVTRNDDTLDTVVGRFGTTASDLARQNKIIYLTNDQLIVFRR